MPRTSNHTLGGYCVGVPPLPIPNREVKPDCADGTAIQCGRVGGRLFSTKPRKDLFPYGDFVFICISKDIQNAKLDVEGSYFLYYDRMVVSTSIFTRLCRINVLKAFTQKRYFLLSISASFTTHNS